MPDENALKCSALNFVDLLPLSSWFSKKMLTSGTHGLPSAFDAAISIAVMKFSRPSLLTMPIGNCEPVKTTGFDRFSSIKLNADALYAMVSEP